MRSPVELIMVSQDNNNKFYRMTDTDDGNFAVEYGRVGVTSIKETYPMSRWDSKYKEKLKKGYRDVSDLKVESKEGEISFDSIDIEHFYKTFLRYTKENVGRNYTIQVGAVTKIMLSEAQDVLNQMLSGNDLNKLLLTLYTILPRRMGNVKDHIFKGTESEKQIQDRISKEQDILDSLSSQVVTNVTENQSLTDLLGATITEEPNFEFVNGIILPTNSSKHRPYKVYKIENKDRKDKFDTWLNTQSNQHVEHLIHGTRNPNIFSILKAGLIIRPTNAVISGAAYGEGIYHSAHSDKSLGYTGYDPDKLFLIQRVHMGNPFTYEGWYRDGKSISRSQMNYNYLKSIGNDSLYVKPGDGLRNSEYIVFNADQTDTNYLVWMK
jgi:poly [ADP-ribose] polymerase